MENLLKGKHDTKGNNSSSQHIDNIQDIRDKYNNDDIYKFVHENVKVVLEDIKKYDFGEKPPIGPDIRPIHTFQNGDKYLGQWNVKTNRIEGQGIYVWAHSGDLYEGYYKNGYRNGKGRLITK